MTRKLYLLTSCTALSFLLAGTVSARDVINENYSGKTNQAGGAFTFEPSEISKIENSSFENNTGISTGGAIQNQGNIDYIKGGKFVGNKSLNGGGGAIYSQNFTGTENNGRIGSVSNVLFSGNSATRLGGAIFHLSQQDIKIDSCVFENNSAGMGGGALNSGQYNGTGADIYIKNSRFTDNTSGYISDGGLGGGALRLDSGAFIFEGENFFKNNKDPEKNNDINIKSGEILVTEGAILTLDGGIIGNGTTFIEKGAEVRAENTANATAFGNETVNNGKITINKNNAAEILSRFTNNGTVENNGILTVSHGANLTLNTGINGKGNTVISAGGEMTAAASDVKISTGIENNGLITVQTGKDLSLNAQALNNAVITNNGILYINNNFTQNDIVAGQGSVEINKTGTLNIENNKSAIENHIQNSGKINIADNAVLTHSGNLNLNAGSSLNMGINSILHTEKYTASQKASLILNIKTNNAENNISHGLVNVAGDVSGTTNVILKFTNNDILDNPEKIKSLFVSAPNDDISTPAQFNISYIYGSPYQWESLYDNEDGSAWYLTYKTNDEPVITPDKPFLYREEVIAGAGLHEAAIEQTRSVVRNVRNKVASGREYCPNCGIYSAEWNGQKLRNIWVLAQGETATIDKPVKMDADIWGVEAGFDVQNDANNTLGIFASYRKGKYDLSGKADKLHSNVGSEIDIDSYLAGLYYRYDKNMNWLFATVYGGVQQVDAKTDDKIAKFDTDGIEFGAGVEAGHTFALSNDLTLDPSLGLYYTQINFDDAKDNVGKEYDWKDIKHLEAELGAKLEKQIDYAKIYVKPSVIQTITSGDSVKITGLNKLSTYDDATLGRIELGGRYGFTDALSAYGWVNYTFGSDYDATAFGAGLNYSW